MRMTRPFDSKVWVTRSQQTIGNVTIGFPEQQRPSKSTSRFDSVAVQRVPANDRMSQRYQDEFIVVNRQKEAATGRWILNVIAAHEAYEKALKMNRNRGQANGASSQLTPMQHPDFDQFLHETMISPTTIDDGPTTPMSSFSSAESVDHTYLRGKSDIPSRKRSNSQSDGDSTDPFNDDEERPCISKPVIIVCIILSIVLIVGIIVAVFVTIFVGKNQSSSTTGKSLDPKSQLASLSTIYDMICPTELFNLTDPFCRGEVTYQYYSCYRMATSTSMTVRFAFQHDTISGHWYFDDFSVVQNANLSLILNGGFEYNLTGWIVSTSVNSSADAYVDTTIGLAHAGSAHLHAASKNDPVYIEQTFNVTIGEYMKISFWWRYDGGVKLGDTCSAIGQLIPSV